MRPLERSARRLGSLSFAALTFGVPLLRPMLANAEIHTCSVSGTVRDASGQALPGARVEYFAAFGQTHVTANNLGQYQLQVSFEAPAGTTVSCNIVVRALVPQQYLPSPDEVVYVPPVGTVDNIDFWLEQGTWYSATPFVGLVTPEDASVRRLNNSGVAVGSAFDGQKWIAARWPVPSQPPLPLPQPPSPGGRNFESGSAVDINDSGRIAFNVMWCPGQLQAETCRSQAYVYDVANPPLQTLSNMGFQASRGESLDEEGRVVGQLGNSRYLDERIGGFWTFNPTAAINLTELNQNMPMELERIKSGRIVGTARFPIAAGPVWRGFLIEMNSPDAVINLGTLPLFTASTAVDVELTPFGVMAVGSCDDGILDTYACRFTLSDGVSISQVDSERGRARAVNQCGQIVGNRQVDAMIWHPASVFGTYLQDVTAGVGGLVKAVDINDLGQILAKGGASYLLTPNNALVSCSPAATPGLE